MRVLIICIYIYTQFSNSTRREFLTTSVLTVLLFEFPGFYFPFFLVQSLNFKLGTVHVIYFKFVTLKSVELNVEFVFFYNPKNYQHCLVSLLQFTFFILKTILIKLFLLDLETFDQYYNIIQVSYLCKLNNKSPGNAFSGLKIKRNKVKTKPYFNPINM